MASKFNRSLIFDSVILGVVGALAAQLFMFMLDYCDAFFMQLIANYQAPGLPNEGGVLTQVIGPHWLWLIPLVTTLGGLISGFIIYTWAPEAEGHGTDTAVRAFHKQDGNIRARVPFLKMIASAITIGSGGAAGREGPIALIASGFGSLYARWTGRSAKEKRILVLVGMSAGLSAIFRSPIGSAIFAVEVLYGGMEFEAGALIYTTLAAIVAYTVNGVFVGWQPLFQVPGNLQIHDLYEYGLYILLGIGCGLVSTIVPPIFYGIRDAFHNISIPDHFKPAIGGLGVGLLALWLPQILGGGYGWIQEAINGQLGLEIMIILVFAKLVAFALTVSSGGSGGVFAPSLYVGAMVGGLIAHLFHQPSAAFVVIGMAALFSGAAHVPFAALLMVTEMTGGYQMLVPAALAVMLSYMIQTHLSGYFKYPSLYEGQVPSRAHSGAHHDDYLNMAMDLLTNQSVSIPEAVGRLDLVSLLKSKIPIDLPNQKKFTVIEIQPDGPCTGQPFDPNCFAENEDEEIEILVLMRNGNIVIPTPNTILKPRDQILLISSEEVWERLRDRFQTPEQMKDIPNKDSESQ